MESRDIGSCKRDEKQVDRFIDYLDSAKKLLEDATDHLELISAFSTVELICVEAEFRRLPFAHELRERVQEYYHTKLEDIAVIH